MKEHFTKATGGTIEIFLSSDGQSIQFGRNWVHRIEQALADASLMFVFLTPNTLRSEWIRFEAGYAYAKGIRVVPVGFLGFDICNLAPPLSLLQGFNITSTDGLNNLIAVTNDEFSHSHPEYFTRERYQAIIAPSGFLAESVFGEYAAAVEDLQISVLKDELTTSTRRDAFTKLAELLSSHDIPYLPASESIQFYGVHVQTVRANPDHISVQAAPIVAANTLPIVGEWLTSVRTAGCAKLPLLCTFVQSINNLEVDHRLTGRLYGTDVALDPWGFSYHGRRGVRS